MRKNTFYPFAFVGSPYLFSYPPGEELVEYKFKPLLGDTGKPVIRAITEADIDALGEAVMETILNG